MDACGDDPELANEAVICVSRILSVPQSQIDKMYFDEVGLRGDEVSKYTPAQLAERYALYKVKRGRFFAPWSVRTVMVSIMAANTGRHISTVSMASNTGSLSSCISLL